MFFFSCSDETRLVSTPAFASPAIQVVDGSAAVTDKLDSNAATTLGTMYEHGRGGLAKDEREAVRLYKLAADQGNDEAKSSVERLTHPSPTKQRGIRKRAK